MKKLGGVDLRAEELKYHDGQNRPTQLTLHVTGKVHHAHDVEVDNFKFLQKQVEGQRPLISPVS